MLILGPVGFSVSPDLIGLPSSLLMIGEGTMLLVE